jgi:hypothetical protein
MGEESAPPARVRRRRGQPRQQAGEDGPHPTGPVCAGGRRHGRRSNPGATRLGLH